MSNAIKYDRIVQALFVGKMLSVTDIAKTTGIAKSTVRNYLYEMRESGDAYICHEQTMPNSWSMKLWTLGTDPATLKHKRDCFERVVKVKQCRWQDVPKAANWGGWLAA